MEKQSYTFQEAADLIMAEWSDFEDEEDGTANGSVEGHESRIVDDFEEDVDVFIFKPTVKKRTDLMDVIIDKNIDYIDEDDLEPQPIVNNIVEHVHIEHDTEAQNNMDVELGTEIIEFDQIVPAEIFLAEQTSAYNITDKKDIQWRNRPFVSNAVSFNSNVESDISVDSVEAPLDIFMRYIPPKLFEDAALYTNMYALQKGSTNFKHTSSTEIMNLFGIHILMGVLGLPQIQLYWNKNLDIKSVSESMARNRFLWLRNNLHFIDNSKIPADCQDKFIKVRPLIDFVQKRCREIPVEEECSIDEQIIPFKGRLSIKQYCKGKPCPWGIKNYVLCGKSGFPYDFVLYQGSTTEICSFDRAQLGFGAAVVNHLIKRFELSGHTLFFDNFFSTYQIFEICTQNNINAAGTVRINRFNDPKFSTDKEMKKNGRGSYEERTNRDENIVIVKWHDNRSVHLASNFVGVGEKRIVRRWDKVEKKYVSIEQPEIVRRYNNAMGGVDLLDQYLSYYRIFIKSRKWTLRVVFHFVDMAICASYLEYKKQCD